MLLKVVFFRNKKDCHTILNFVYFVGLYKYALKYSLFGLSALFVAAICSRTKVYESEMFKDLWES